jgi:hypothetical protein
LEENTAAEAVTHPTAAHTPRPLLSNCVQSSSTSDHGTYNKTTATSPNSDSSFPSTPIVPLLDSLSSAVGDEFGTMQNNNIADSPLASHLSHGLPSLQRKTTEKNTNNINSGIHLSPHVDQSPSTLCSIRTMQRRSAPFSTRATKSVNSATAPISPHQKCHFHTLSEFTKKMKDE